MQDCLAVRWHDFFEMPLKTQDAGAMLLFPEPNCPGKSVIILQAKPGKPIKMNGHSQYMTNNGGVVATYKEPLALNH